VYGLHGKLKKDEKIIDFSRQSAFPDSLVGAI
jgi:hypothetical protein